MDLGYLVIAVFVGLAALVIWANKGRRNGKRDGYHHTPLKGHRQEGSDVSGGID